MGAVSPVVVGMVLLTAALQVFGLALLPLTRGFTQWLPSLGVAVSFVTSLAILSRPIHMGTNLGLLIPIMAVLIPAGTIVVGILFYGEAASLGKLAALAGAMALITWSNFL